MSKNALKREHDQKAIAGRRSLLPVIEAVMVRKLNEERAANDGRGFSP